MNRALVALLLLSCDGQPGALTPIDAAFEPPNVDARAVPAPDATPPGLDAAPPLPACGTADSAPCSAFEDVTASSGIAGDLSTSPAGDVVAFGDLDGDGRLDLARSGRDGLTVWRNIGDGMLEPATASLGLSGASAENVIIPADLDGDGRMDLLLLGMGFAEVHRGVVGGFAIAVGALPDLDYDRAVTAAVADYDGDGDLDIFIAQDPSHATPGYLLANDGTGVFDDVSAVAGLTQPGTITLQALWLDYDADGDPDLVLANDRGPSSGFTTQLFRNDDGVLVDVTDTAGMGPAIDGMGLVSGDIDGDGDLDLYVSNSPHTPTVEVGHLLLLNGGAGGFVESANALGVDAQVLGWGVAMPDFDGDGDLDLLAVADAKGGPPGTRMFENLGADGFRDVTEDIGLTDGGDAYGVSVGDYDGDGFVDIAVAHTLYGPPVTLYRNTGSPYHWLKIRLRGAPPNTAGTGAVVTATVAGRTLIRSTDAGSGFGGANPPEILLGLGNALTVGHLEVQWPTGAVTTLDDVDADQVIYVDE